MSLDVYIRYKVPKPCRDAVACGSTVRFFKDGFRDRPASEDKAHLNVTHNMNHMAMEVPVKYSIYGENYESTLYNMVWRPDEIGDGKSCRNTDVMRQALTEGICYMIKNRQRLEEYNPANGWGNYNSFLYWLLEYKNICEENPDCEIEISR